MRDRCYIAVVSVASGMVKNLSSTSGLSDEHPRYSPDGRYLAWHAYDTARAFNDQGHVRLYDRRTARVQPLMPQFDRATHHVDWTPDSRALLFLADDRGRVGLWRAALDAKLPVPVVRGGTISGYARSADASVLAYTRASAMHPPAVFASRGDGSGEHAIETLNQALLARHALGAVREFTIKGWNGEPVQMFVTYPPNFDPAKKWPLMHSIHGGPHAAHQDGWHFRWNAQVFAGQGFIVPQVNYHGSSGFGQKFLETITKRYGEKEFADVEAATDYLLRQGYIDRARLTATGGSYGRVIVAFLDGRTQPPQGSVCQAATYVWACT